jgi:hypothetical protein
MSDTNMDTDDVNSTCSSSDKNPMPIQYEDFLQRLHVICSYNTEIMEIASDIITEMKNYEPNETILNLQKIFLQTINEQSFYAHELLTLSEKSLEQAHREPKKPKKPQENVLEKLKDSLEKSIGDISTAVPYQNQELLEWLKDMTVKVDCKDSETLRDRYLIGKGLAKLKASNKSWKKVRSDIKGFMCKSNVYKHHKFYLLCKTYRKLLHCKLSWDWFKN